MPKAIWNDHVVAETEQFEEVEGNIYFPPEALKRELVRESERTTVCGWKGTASYFDLVDGDQQTPNAGPIPIPSPQPPTSRTTSPSTARRCGSRARLPRG